MIEAGLRTLLMEEATIAALAQPRAIDGISFPAVFVDVPVQGFAPPFLVISVIDTDPLVAMDGTSGLMDQAVSIDAYHPDSGNSKALAAAVSDFLKDYTGPAGDDTINAVIWKNATDHQIWTQDGRDVRYYVRSLSFRIQHS